MQALPAKNAFLGMKSIEKTHPNLRQHRKWNESGTNVPVSFVASARFRTQGAITFIAPQATLWTTVVSKGQNTQFGWKNPENRG